MLCLTKNCWRRVDFDWFFWDTRDATFRPTKSNPAVGRNGSISNEWSRLNGIYRMEMKLDWTLKTRDSTMTWSHNSQQTMVSLCFGYSFKASPQDANQPKNGWNMIESKRSRCKPKPSIKRNIKLQTKLARQARCYLPQAQQYSNKQKHNIGTSVRKVLR